MKKMDDAAMIKDTETMPKGTFRGGEQQDTETMPKGTFRGGEQQDIETMPKGTFRGGEQQDIETMPKGTFRGGEQIMPTAYVANGSCKYNNNTSPGYSSASKPVNKSCAANKSIPSVKMCGGGEKEAYMLPRGIFRSDEMRVAHYFSSG